MKPLAMSSAFCASPAEATEPIRMIESATVLTVISLPGSATLSSSLSSPMSRPTVTSIAAILLPSAARAKIVVWPLATAAT